MKLEHNKKYDFYVCPNCFRKINECICKKYPQSLVYIDEKMQDIIIRLNDKGYLTCGCCEAHFGKNRFLYVSFPKKYDFAILPPGENRTIKKGSSDIIYYITADTKEKFEEKKKIKLLELSAWVDRLPSLKNKE